MALRLGLRTVAVDPSTCADTIVAAALSQRAAIVAPLPVEGTWDWAVALAIAKRACVLLVFVTANETPLPIQDAPLFEVGSDLGGVEKLRWLSAVAEDAQNELPVADLRSLEAWWTKARRVAPDAAPTFDALDEATRQILACMALAGRSMPTATLATIARVSPADAVAAIETLVSAGLARQTGDLLSTAPSLDFSSLASSIDHATRLAVAAYLTEKKGGSEPDPWAFARAAELLVSAGAFDDADTAISNALRAGSDPQVSGEIGARWFDVVRPIAGPGGLRLRMRAAERSLLLGEAGDVQRWCESAAALEPNAPSIRLLMARAQMLLGDLVAARVCLDKAEALAKSDDGELRSSISAERAELCYMTGDLDQAATHATRAFDMATTPAPRLGARSTLGKIHLARGDWDLADQHFAEDALSASLAKEVTAELRARTNRAIALLYKGRVDEARAMLERVLEEGTLLGEERARAYALANLGVVAYRQRDYGSALVAWEKTIRFPQALLGRLATEHTIGNLADLRLRLGLVDHAGHAIAFGKKIFAGSALPRSSAIYKRVSAQIALARGNTELARREVESSLADALASGDNDSIEWAYLVAARVALEDGDTAAAGEALAHARAIATSPRGCAEVAIVHTALLRSMGQPALDSANEALALAREAGDDDLLSEIHTLLAHLHRDAGDRVTARAHCSRAIAVRDQVAAGLPPDIRAAFFAKPEFCALSRLQTSLAQDEDGEEEAPRTERSPARAESSMAREIIGDDPAIRSLTVAIRKVAKSNSTILIHGESGTGKELVAEALHRASDRASGPLVSVNCAALVETLLLSELFGHEKGAFTGASARRRGRFEMAEGGTLFLDEIGDISPRTQVALLRVLQERTFERVGGTTPLRANVRVICATHRDLRAMVERGEFREDLYYRLRGITLEVPALRARIGDLPKIAEHLLGRIALERNEQKKRLATDAIELLCRHRWPGNIRELENVLRAVSLFAEGGVITAADIIDNVDDLRAVARNVERSTGPLSQAPLRPSLLPPPPSTATSIAASPAFETDDDDVSEMLPEDEANATAVAYAQVRQGAVSLSDMKRQIERDCIARALTETKGNITRAAAILGMKRPRLSQLVKQYGLSVASSEGIQ